MRTNRGIHRLMAFGAVAALACVQTAFGQLSSQSIVGYSTQSSGGILSLQYTGVSDTSLANATVTGMSFTGNDGAGNPQTMTFSGWTNTQSSYGQLHGSSSVTIGNTYFNANNPDYDPSTGQGSPASLDALGVAQFTDTLQFGGDLQAGYQARYIFHIDGSTTGNLGENVGSALGIFVDGGSEVTAWFGNSVVNTDYATKGYAVNGITPQTINVQFDTQDYADLNLNVYPDGSYLSGLSNFSDTSTLVGIEMLDANGNLVTSGWTVTSGSGTKYNQILATPEPSSLAVFGIGALGIFLRRRARRA